MGKNIHKRIIVKRCLEEDCDKTVTHPTSFYCEDHRLRKQRQRSRDRSYELWDNDAARCLFPGCGTAVKGSSLYCGAHKNGKAGPMDQLGQLTKSDPLFTTTAYEDGSPRHSHAGELVVSLKEAGLPIELLGAQKSQLKPKQHFRPDCLIINCTGFPIAARPIVVRKPKKLKGIEQCELVPEELCLDIEDREAPRLTPAFWYQLAEAIRAARYNTVIACCVGGHGRTGTVLACLLLALGAAKSAEAAIATVRKNYCERAIENRTQEDYDKSVERGRPS